MLLDLGPCLCLRAALVHWPQPHGLQVAAQHLNNAVRHQQHQLQPSACGPGGSDGQTKPTREAFIKLFWTATCTQMMTLCSSGDIETPRERL